MLNAAWGECQSYRVISRQGLYWRKVAAVRVRSNRKISTTRKDGKTENCQQSINCTEFIYTANGGLGSLQNCSRFLATIGTI